jgi:hypothetical protein
MKLSFRNIYFFNKLKDKKLLLLYLLYKALIGGLIFLGLVTCAYLQSDLMWHYMLIYPLGSVILFFSNKKSIVRLLFDFTLLSQFFVLDDLPSIIYSFKELINDFNIEQLGGSALYVIIIVSCLTLITATHNLITDSINLLGKGIKTTSNIT